MALHVSGASLCADALSGGDAGGRDGEGGLSLSELRALIPKLHAEGRSLHELLAADARTGSLRVELTKTEAETPQPVKAGARQAYLKERRAFLQEESEKRQYSQLVGTVRKAEAETADRDSFATFTQQGSLGLNFFVSVLTAGACGYYLGASWFGPGEMPWILAGVFGVAMLLIDAVIIILRLSTVDRNEERRKQRPAQPMGPLGVEAASADATVTATDACPTAPTDAVPKAAVTETSTSGVRRRRR